MFNQQVNGVLTLIALSIFADKRILASEITAFIKSAKFIDKNLKSDVPITEENLLIWFERHRIRLRDKVNLGPIGFERWFESILAEISDFENVDFIMELIKKISQADGEVHISEDALLALVKQHLSHRVK